MTELSNSQRLYREHLLNKISFRDFYISKHRLNLELGIPYFRRLEFEELLLTDMTTKTFTALCGCQNVKEHFTWDEYDNYIKQGSNR